VQHVRDAAFHRSEGSGIERAMVEVAENATASLRATQRSHPDLTGLTPTTSYSGIPSALIRPGFKAACTLRPSNPDVNDISSHTKTRLDVAIVGAILEDALRLLPVGHTIEGQTARRAVVAVKFEQALTAEEAFLSQLRATGHRLLDEWEQRQQIQVAIEDD